MARTRRSLAVALLSCLMLVLLVVASFAAEASSSVDKKEKAKKGSPFSKVSTHYVILDPNPATGQERFFCLAKGSCRYKILECPAECGVRKPKKNKKNKGCLADCSSRCETTCKYRKANCKGFGSICYDPRFVGGDGTMFYFHGAKGGDFALVSDDNLHINAHFIGTRPEGRTRDFTWVQALSIMFDSHTLVIAAKRVAVWDDNVDALVLRYDSKDIAVSTDGEAEWRIETEDNSDKREVVIERTDEFNSIKVAVSGLLELDVKVTPIGEEEDRVHGYKLPAGDAFAHLETQFNFKDLSDKVEGVLGQTYQPDYVSPVKKGVPMPMIGGADRPKPAPAKPSFENINGAGWSNNWNGSFPTSTTNVNSPVVPKGLPPKVPVEHFPSVNISKEPTERRSRLGIFQQICS